MPTAQAAMMKTFRRQSGAFAKLIAYRRPINRKIRANGSPVGLIQASAVGPIVAQRRIVKNVASLPAPVRRKNCLPRTMTSELSTKYIQYQPGAHKPKTLVANA